MKMARRQFVVTAPLAFAALNLPTQETRWRGKLVCLTEELQRHQVTPDCNTRGHVYALKTAAGKLHPILPTEGAAALWLDERFRKLDLQIVGRSFAETEFIEVIKLQNWHDGKLYEPEYYCIVCNISVYKPGPCECCQDPVEYREVLVTEK